MRTFLYLMGILGFFQLSAQDLPQYSSSELKKDLAFMKVSIEKYNPALGKFHPKAQFDSTYRALLSQIEKEEKMTGLDFYPLLVQLARSTWEGHHVVGSLSDSLNQIYQGFFNGRFKYLPLAIKKTEGKVFLWANFSPDTSLVRGAEILRINGLAIEEILAKLAKYVLQDADIHGFSQERAQDRFASYYYWFYERPAEFNIRYRTSSQEEAQEILIPALSRDSMLYWRDQRYGKAEEKQGIAQVYEFKMDGNQACLDLNNFNRELMIRHKINPYKLFKGMFKTLKKKKIKHLIIDLRDNPGGRRRYPLSLLPFLMKKDSYSDVLMETISWQGKVHKIKFPERSKWAFKGQVYVLMNYESFSNGSVAAMWAKEYGEALLIGRETGTRYEGFAAGSTEYVTLPHSKIQIGIPRFLLLYEHPKEPTIKNRGLMPDYPVHYTLQDYLEQKDLDMEKAQELIKAQE